ncbi:hypothetical protein C8R41DRAFT_81805 [Lentinula lateritia]|uniref:Uncharacterized protein n=1 Tax=Lentinula lateritia TaxID=40482 RepID=A0ABQ8VRP1_9AGAR|nr:hypothetical protein C8R41DRAFT_81805 [Lentinula lateritia]
MNCDVKSFWAFTLNGLDEVILPRVVTCFQPSQNFVSPLSPSLSRAMVISFIPAIDEVAHVAIPEWHATDSTVELRFSAVLGDEDFQQFKKNGMKVQVWSNIPLGRRNEGEWGEIDLHEANEPASVGSSDDSQISLVALCNESACGPRRSLPATIRAFPIFLIAITVPSRVLYTLYHVL